MRYLKKCFSFYPNYFKELVAKILDSLRMDELDNELDQILECNNKFEENLVKLMNVYILRNNRKVNFHLF